jgi:asparagine N-glycosylation enzyme membrane subunit Stt3
MDDTKPVWASKTLWGAVIAILGAAAGLLGITPEQLPSADEVVTVIGGVLAIVGRFMATKPIG